MPNMNVVIKLRSHRRWMIWVVALLSLLQAQGWRPAAWCSRLTKWLLGQALIITTEVRR